MTKQITLDDIRNAKSVYLYCDDTLYIVDHDLNWTNYKPDIDLADASYSVYSSERRYIDFRISDRKLTLACQDFGPECEIMNGGNEYEFFYSLDEDKTLRFLERLRMEYGFKDELADLLKKAFCSDNGPSRFTEFCDKNHIKYSFFSY